MSLYMQVIGCAYTKQTIHYEVMLERFLYLRFESYEIEVFIMEKTMSATMSQTSEMTKLALLIALNCISAYIIIPLPFSQSPIALQTMIVNLTAFLLPPKKALLVMIAYIGIGMIGIPVFTGGTAGPGKMFGPTGGYIWGFAVAVWLMSLLKGKTYHFRRFSLVAIIVGIPVIYLFGAVQLQLVTHMTWEAVMVSGVLPFIPLDIVKCIAAATLARPIYKLFGAV